MIERAIVFSFLFASRRWGCGWSRRVAGFGRWRTRFSLATFETKAKAKTFYLKPSIFAGMGFVGAFALESIKVNVNIRNVVGHRAVS